MHQQPIGHPKNSSSRKKSNVLLFRPMQPEGNKLYKLEEFKVYRFSDFTVDPMHRQLFDAEGKVISLTPKTFDLLLVLVESGGRIVTKDELMSTVWQDTFVEEANLAQTISMLRKALGDGRNENRFIITVPRHGYRFVPNIEEVFEKRNTRTLINTTLNPPQTDDVKSIADVHTTEEKKEKTTTAQKWHLPVGIGLGVLLCVTLAFVYLNRNKEPKNISDVKSIAILPFKNVGGKPEEEYIGQGLSEVLISKLSNIKTIMVRPTSAVLKYSVPSPDPKKIGNELNVDAIVIGGVQRIDEEIRVTVQLIRVSDNATLWAETFDDKFTNIFAVQDSISQKVATTLSVKLTQGEREQIVKNYTANADAYKLYLQGRFHWNKRTRDDLQKAISFFEQAVHKDQNFALAYSGTASCYVLLPEYYGATTHEAFPKAKVAVKRALEIDDQLAEAHTALAYIKAFYDWDFLAADKSFKRAIELNPNYATAHQWYSEFLFNLGRIDESFLHIERALQIDPVSPIILSDLTANYYYQHKFDEAIEHSKKLLDLYPQFPYGHFYLGLSYEHKGMYAEASEHLVMSMTFLGEPPEFAEEVKAAFKKNGMKGWWQKRLEQIETRPQLKYIPDFSKAFVYARVGDKDRAFECLNKAYDHRERWMVGLNYAIDFESLHDDPRFTDLLKRIGLK